MTLWAIVPVKPLREGKSRLAGVLDPEQRSDLNRRMLIHTLETLQQVRLVEQVLVISRDPQALAIARDQHIRTVLENGTPYLNTALWRATLFAREAFAKQVLVLPADLPLVKAEHLELFLRARSDAPSITIAADRRGEGTNALLVDPAGLIQYRFGERSFQTHCRLAQEAGAAAQIVSSPELELDVDLPEDLELAIKMLREAGEGEVLFNPLNYPLEESHD